METLIIGLCISIGAAFFSLIDKWQMPKKSNTLPAEKTITKPSKKKNALSIITFIFGALGAYLSFHVGKASVDSKIKNDSLLVIKERENKALNDSLISKQNRIIALQLETSGDIIGLQKENRGLQNELYNQVTEGNAKPIVKMFYRKAKQDDINYYIFFFDIVNYSKYPIKNVQGKFSDMVGGELFDLGIQVERKGIGSVFGVQGFSKGNSKFSPFSDFNLGTIAKGYSYPIYTACYNPNGVHGNRVTYPIQIQWNGGIFYYFINLDCSNNKDIVESVELLYNGKKINYKPYFLHDK